MSIADGVARAGRSILAAVMIEKRRCYRAIFQEDDGGLKMEAEHVLADLRRFCRADRSSFDLNPHQTARLEGRREVWLRLHHYLNLTDEQVNRFREIESEHY